MSLSEWEGSQKLPAPVSPVAVTGRFPLPLVAPSQWPSLEQSIACRRTSRSFDPQALLPLEVLTRFLVFSCGRTAAMDLGTGLEGAYHRAAPSAGARYPIDMCLVSLRVASIPTGAYRYDGEQHELELVRPGFFADDVARWALNQPWMANASVVFALVAAPGRIEERYAARGYRYILMEAGHIAQNLYLLGAAHGMCVQATGGFFEDAFGRLLGLDETACHVVYLIAAGPPSPVRGLAPW